MVYTEPIAVEELIEHIEKKNDIGFTKDILIVGCGACANISCSYYRGAKEPAMSLTMKPVAIEKEIEIISTELRKKYNSVRFMSVKALCAVIARSERKVVDKAKDADTIIIMSCPGGFKAVEGYLDDQKLIMEMRVKGFKSPKIKFKAKGLYVE